MKLNSLRMLLVSLVVAAVILTVTLVSGFGPGNATSVEAGGPNNGNNVEEFDGFDTYSGFGGGTQSFGGTWSGWD